MPGLRAPDDRPLGSRVALAVGRQFLASYVEDQGRQEIVGALRQYFAEVDAKRQPVSDREADGIIDEAMRNSRPVYRPHHLLP